ncbi:S26 family signal peptidase [Sphingomonas parapaucimobilis]|uniref:Conjugal transfer protein TraF n=1 Tax=Sphingomonas parapaucimobilis NBRC 15100 TaxID=1219049 RepID=A0A0A1W4J1_9SPHN|nr:S26 family signal peptidase [Sphingomonas parapaucimobilis]GAM00315.1 conjugal transfer protein TraF [Sphingomonas parapaucimobilis NBRC 15100]
MSAGRTGIGGTPLLDWGDTLRAAKTRHRRRVRRIGIGAVGIAVLLSTVALPPAPRLVWNASASAPIGLYAVAPGIAAQPGDMVVARLPEPYRRLAATRRYLPLNVPLVKRVAAAPGDDVCALGPLIFVNGRPVAKRLDVDRAGRPLPHWSGCRRLRGDQRFLLMDAPASFDGRYFGVTEGVDIIGKARLLWAR